MTKLAILSALALSLPGLAAAQGGPIRASLTSYQEVPSVSSTAEGEFEARVAKDGLSFDYRLVYAGLQADAIMAHIHFAQRGVNGPIVVWLCGTATNPGPAGTQPCPVREGVITGTVTTADVSATPAAQQLAAGDVAALVEGMRAGAAYVNVHTVVSTGGELRGQIGTHGKSGKGK